MPVVKLPLVARTWLQRIAERLDVLSLPGAEAELSDARRLGVHFQECQIVGRVLGDELSGLEVSLSHADANIQTLLDDVGVGDEVALVRHEDAGAGTRLVRLRLFRRGWNGLRRGARPGRRCDF